MSKEIKDKAWNNTQNSQKIQELKEILQAQKEKQQQLRSHGLESLHSKEVRLHSDDNLPTQSSAKEPTQESPKPEIEQPAPIKKSKKKRDL